jgi:Tfp pilus assembly protein PilV
MLLEAPYKATSATNRSNSNINYQQNKVKRYLFLIDWLCVSVTLAKWITAKQLLFACSEHCASTQPIKKQRGLGLKSGKSTEVSCFMSIGVAIENKLYKGPYSSSS